MLVAKSLIKTSLIYPSILFRFGVMDKLHENRKQKALDEFQKKMAFLANKPTYTYLDLKQTAVEELANAQSIRGKLAKESAETVLKLETDIKMLNALFDQELTTNKLLSGIQMNQIALTTGVNLKKVEQMVGYFSHVKKMHLYLRTLKQQNIPLPRDMKEMRAGMIQNRAMLKDEKQQQQIQKRRTNSRRTLLRHIKFGRQK